MKRMAHHLLSRGGAARGGDGEPFLFPLRPSPLIFPGYQKRSLFDLGLSVCLSVCLAGSLPSGQAV